MMKTILSKVLLGLLTMEARKIGYLDYSTTYKEPVNKLFLIHKIFSWIEAMRPRGLGELFKTLLDDFNFVLMVVAIGGEKMKTKDISSLCCCSVCYKHNFQIFGHMKMGLLLYPQLGLPKHYCTMNGNLFL